MTDRSFYYTVKVTAESEAEADQVIDARIYVDEDYGFDYTIELTDPEPSQAEKDARAEGIIR